MISFVGEDGENVELIVLDKTEFNGNTYILAEESEEDETFAYILKQEQDSEKEIVYSIVDDDKELDAVAAIFEELLDGEVDIVPEDEV